MSRTTNRFIFLGVMAVAFALSGRASAQEQDSIMGRLKPADHTTSEEAVGMCASLAKNAKVRTLVIAFEGLASFDASGAESVYQYLAELRRTGRADEEQIHRGRGGFLLHGLVVPTLLKQGKSIEFISLPNTAVTDEEESAASVCATLWKKAHPANKLIVLGHSFGGHAAYQLSEVLKTKNVKVDLVLTVDARDKRPPFAIDWARPKNVVRSLNYFRKGFSLPGYAIEGADLNEDLSGTGVAHLTIPTAEPVHEALNLYLKPKPVRPEM